MEIESISVCFYKKNVGHYESLRNFHSRYMKWEWIGLNVYYTPCEFWLTQYGTMIIREYVSAHLPKLCEIEKTLAENSKNYFVICYSDNSERYFKYDKDFFEIFDVAPQFEATEESDLVDIFIHVGKENMY